MTPEVINLLVQLPLVGIFVWFTLNRDKASQLERQQRDQQFLAAQERRDLAYLKALEEITCIVQEHDRKVDLLRAEIITRNEYEGPRRRSTDG